MKMFSKILAICMFATFLLTACGETPERQKANTEKLQGDVQKTVGDVTNDDELKSEGAKNQVKGGLRNTKEDVKDALKGD